MKFPFDFSLTLVFRLIFPGLVLAVALLPLVSFALKAEGLNPSLSTLVPVEAVLFGWAVVLLDQPIYMLYEGRRYWPKFLRKWCIRLQSATLSLALKESESRAGDPDKETKKEIDLRKHDFPLADDGEPKAIFPTALGNLINAFESYPKKKYGMDAIFYWPRLWVALDKDVREILDQAQALADSAIYVSFSLLVSAAVFGLYAVSYPVAPFLHVAPVDLPYLPPPGGSVFIAVLLFYSAYFVYRLGFHAQRQYGDLFRSLFDQFRGKLDFAYGAAEIAVEQGAGRLEAIDNPFLVASRFLRFHRIRPAGEAKNVTPEAWSARQKNSQSGGRDGSQGN